ncbi:MAG TPA: DUF5671 domain-containing protein [Candidatus Paceibacterota bacterium]|nr:DUF5671 domain-containing protein [Candidatus Paceibacterota bacterium]HRZ34459.1 DUF5671 domain-containing protein [Candidatus Paceibacterota bacterium]
MDPTKSKTTARDFFIYLGVIIGLYVSVVNLINLLFSLINKWLPDVNDYFASFDEGVRIALAILIIFFPAFLYLSHLATKTLVSAPEKKEMWIRRWSYFLTLFLSGLAIAIDLSSLIYRFIGGEDLTPRFLLKTLIVFLVALAIFRFYLYELRRDVSLPTPKRKYLLYTVLVFFVVIVIGSIISIGSPTQQRQARFDSDRIEDLTNISSAITDYYHQNSSLPENLVTLAKSGEYYTTNSINDPETAEEYGYIIASSNSYKLCATFSRPSEVTKWTNIWEHGAGLTCFERTIGEEVLPKAVK